MSETAATQHRPHKHLRTQGPGDDPAHKRIVLVGNPNVGKSVVFNYLSGLYVDVSNFPGTTVELSKATYLNYDLYDTRWARFRLGPMEAIREFMKANHDFVIDRSKEKFLLTWYAAGFLKRVR